MTPSSPEPVSGNGDTGDWDVDAFLDGYKPRTRTVTMYQRGDLLDGHANLEAELARLAVGEDAAGAKATLERLLALEAELGGSGRTFAIQACSHEEWYRLMAAHPPTEAERQADPESAVGADFQAHAIAACAHRPALTIAQVGRMRSALRPDDFDRVWLAVIEAVKGRVEAPKSELATAVARIFAASSTQPATPARRRRSSSAGNGGPSPTTSTTRKAS